MSDDFAKDIIKRFGKGILVGGNDILDEKIDVLPISPSLNVLLAGGVPEGSWINLSSKPGVGKTTTALHIAANCQKPEYGARDVYYLDIEGRFKKRNIQGIRNLDKNKFHLIRSSPDKILTGQDFLQIGEDILKGGDRRVLIIDSYSSVCHENELLGGIGTSTRGAGGYSLLSGFTRQMSQVVPVKKHLVIGIAQMMANVTGYGPAMQEKGGNSIMYQADVWLRAKAMKLWEAGGKPIGQIVTWQTVKAALHGAITGAEMDSYIRFGIGIDVMQELVVFAQDIGLIEKNGAWYVCNYMANHLDVLGAKQFDDAAAKLCKFHGEAKLYEHLSTHPQWFKLLETDIMKMMTGQK